LVLNEQSEVIMKKGAKLTLGVLGIAGLGVGVYFLTNWLLNRGGNGNDNDQYGSLDQTPDSNPIIDTVNANTDIDLQKGSRGEQVKTLQLIFNDIRHTAHTLLPNATHQVTSGQMSQKKYVRLQELASVSSLTQDGVFGSGTEAVCMVIMGSRKTTLNKAKCKRRDVYVAYGKTNPYRGTNLSC
jgi:hypothetical protein